ncbi:MAG: ABC transporter permease [Sphingomonadales bacterium]|nr:ABC transporter permease [Sphingomonadales bacterium]
MAGLAKGRLSTVAAALVVARRDFSAILFSRSFIFFLIGPLFPILVGLMAGSVGDHVQKVDDSPEIGVMMPSDQADRLMTAHRAMQSHMDGALPDFRLMERREVPQAEAQRALQRTHGNLAAIVSGTLESPVLTGPNERIQEWQGPIELVTARALQADPAKVSAVRLAPIATTTRADIRHGQVMTAQAGQMLLFLLTMLLAGMVLSNLVEEKGNKIIEVLAAAIPMDAVFLGKLFAMLAVSMVGIAVWGAAGVGVRLLAGSAMPHLDTPAIGWPSFIGLGIVYFAMAYLLLGTLFLTIGSMAATVREVQTLSMPVTMLQLFVFFFASYAMAKPGSLMEVLAVSIPFSSPYAMLARAAVDPALWPHLAALAWQGAWVGIFVRIGATIFRRRVMKSGAASGRAGRPGLWDRLAGRRQAA